MYYEKPGGTMHEVIRRAFDELRLHNNPQGAITIVTHAFSSAEGLPTLSSGVDLNGDIPQSSVHTYSRPSESSAGAASGYGNNNTTNRSSTQSSMANSMQWLTAGTVGVAMTNPGVSSYGASSYGVPAVTLPSGSAEWLNKRHTFNRTQILRLLLLRCEAFSSIKQHARALQDAERAVEVSRGQSAEAYFNVGREQRRQFNIAESASAFDTAEALLRSMQQAIAAGKVVVDGWSQETTSDEEFWADRGFQMDEVRDMGITRQEYEMQERSSRRIGGGNSFSGPNSPTVGGGPQLLEPQTPLSTTTAGNNRGRGRFGVEATAQASLNASPFEGQLSRGNSTTTRSVNLNASLVTEGGAGAYGTNTNNNGHNEDDNADIGAAASTYVTDLIQCGMTPNELSMWRRLASESRALLTMRQTHTVPSTVLSSTMTLLDRRISGTRGGIVISIENNSHTPLRFVGALAPDGLYHEGYSFPDVIQKAHCGVAMLHPRGWGGYSGAVCYELNENLCCFLYFDSPLLGSVKYGVRFVDLRAADLRRAYAEVYKETGVYGIAGGTTTLAITPLAAAAAASSRNGTLGGSAGNSGSRGVSIRGATTPLTTTVAGMNAARAAIRMPPSNTWVAAHAASAASQRPVKASARMVGGQAIAFTLAERLSVRLRSVELLPALEYVGAVTLKKLSCVSRRYRELINHLPPPMFYGLGRRSYPDYCVYSDRFTSPWVVRDLQPVTWKLVFDGRLGDQEEFSMADESDPQKHILCFSADAQTKVTGYVYLGDKRCLQYIVKESWIPFSNTLYITTPIGRTFASCITTNNQTHFTLCLSTASYSGGGGAGGGGNQGGASAGAPRTNDDVLYTARKRVQPSAATGGGSTPSSAVGIARIAEDVVVTPAKATATPSSSAPPQAHAVAATGGGPAAVVATAVPTATASSAINNNSITGAAAAAAASGGVVKGVSPRPANSPSPGVSPSGAAGAAPAAASTAAPPKPDYFTVWRSQRVSGGAVAGGAGPTTTNGGADIIAEVKMNPVTYGMVTKGYCAAEVTFYPGADAMLVSLLAFLISRW